MRISWVVVLAPMLALAGLADAAPGADGYRLAQNSGAVDRSLGNGSMGMGEGIERLPEQRRHGEAPEVPHQTPRASKYDESSHGDIDPDMEHRRHRTLDDDDEPDD